MNFFNIPYQIFVAMFTANRRNVYHIWTFRNNVSKKIVNYSALLSPWPPVPISCGCGLFHALRQPTSCGFVPSL